MEIENMLNKINLENNNLIKSSNMSDNSDNNSDNTNDDDMDDSILDQPDVNFKGLPDKLDKFKKSTDADREYIAGLEKQKAAFTRLCKRMLEVIPVKKRKEYKEELKQILGEGKYILFIFFL